jgi:hypothetical protein
MRLFGSPLFTAALDRSASVHGRPACNSHGENECELMAGISESGLRGATKATCSLKCKDASHSAAGVKKAGHASGIFRWADDLDDTCRPLLVPEGREVSDDDGNLRQWKVDLAIFEISATSRELTGLP